MEMLILPPARLFGSLPPDGVPGSTHYAPPGVSHAFDAVVSGEDRDALIAAAEASDTGSVLLVHPGGAVLVIPPLVIEREEIVPAIDTTVLRELLMRRRSYAALLLRRGGYTIGFFRGDFVVTSKTDRRFVKNRHRAGGQSQRRFDRIRDKQIHELFGKACEDAQATLAPHAAEIERLYLGGDRQALIAFRKQCPWLDRTFGARVAARILPVAGDPRRVSLDAVPGEVASSRLFVIGQDG